MGKPRLKRGFFLVAKGDGSDCAETRGKYRVTPKTQKLAQRPRIWARDTLKPNNLAEAERLFAQAKAAVERKHEIIDALVRDGRPTGEALVELAGLTDALPLLLKDLEKERAYPRCSSAAGGEENYRVRCLTTECDA